MRLRASEKRRSASSLRRSLRPHASGGTSSAAISISGSPKKWRGSFRMLKPRALRSGDRIAIVSPTSAFKREEFDLGGQTRRGLGFEPVWGRSVFDRTGYVSGSPAIRAGAFLDAWKDPAIAAVVAARGGYGSVHLLPL